MIAKTINPAFLDDVVSTFSFPKEFVKINAFGSGLINDTYLISYTTNNKKYILQRINHHIFKNVECLMDNFLKVTAHIQKQIQLRYPIGFEKRTLLAEQALNGEYLYKDLSGDYWRVFNYIENTRTYDSVTTVKQAYEGGRGFGEFQSFLSNLDPANINETIPGFHDVNKRLIAFWSAVSLDPLSRVKELFDEIELINAWSDRMGYIVEQGRMGNLPLRVVHNDTKFNNVLLDQNDIAQCVIDLDTVMPGYVAYDFGDAIRSIVNTAPEDEVDLDKIDVNLSFYKAFATGYLNETIGFLSQNEIDSLAEGAILFPYMQAVRFLTDYIEGDCYYKTNFEGHNLQRAKAQLQLFKKMEAQYEQLKLINLEISESIISIKKYTNAEKLPLI